MAATAFQQALLTEYAPGAAIGWHKDRSVFGLHRAEPLQLPAQLVEKVRRVVARLGDVEPHVGEFREGIMMTRFFSQLVLAENGLGSLQPFAEELPEPVAEP